MKRFAKYFYAFTLVEILITLTLGLVLLSVIGRVYLGSKKNFTQQQEMAVIQERGSLASYFLTKNIRNSGYTGCISNRISNAIMGYSSSNLPDFLLGRKIIKDSDVIVITKADKNLSALINDSGVKSDVISVENNPASENYPWIFISDCDHFDVAKALSFGKKIRLDRYLNHDYLKNYSQVAGIETIAYFVADTGYENQSGKPARALYYLIKSAGNSDRQALVEGVNNLHFLFGVDSDGDDVVDEYLQAQQIDDWGEVKSVLVTLELVESHKTMEWNTYIALRERI